MENSKENQTGGQPIISNNSVNNKDIFNKEVKNTPINNQAVSQTNNPQVKNPQVQVNTSPVNNRTAVAPETNIPPKNIPPSPEPGNKKSKWSMTIGIIAFIILVLVGASFLGRSIIDRQNKDKKEANTATVLGDFSMNGFTCHDSFKYFVITRADTSGNAGDDILVKNKVNQENKIVCDYKVGDNDFELLNTPSGGSPLAQHFSYINDNLLIVDQGTSTSRSFKIYDLDKETKVFGDNYSAGLFDLTNGVLTYWHRTSDIPNKDNCSKVDEYNKQGGAKIEGKISLNLSNFKKTYTGFRCLPVE